MTNLKNITVGCVTAAVLGLGMWLYAEDDLDDLLNDLESETPAAETAEAPAPATETAAPAAETAAPAAEESEPEVEAEESEAEVEPEAEAEENSEVPSDEEVAAEEPKAEEPPAPSEEPAAVEGATADDSAKPVEPVDDEAELLANISASQRLHVQAFEAQAKREISAAREAMNGEDYDEAARHYGLALKLLNDGPKTKKLRRECEQGVAESLYRAALQDWRIGRREHAKKLMKQAIDRRHPKARRQLEAWIAESGKDEPVVDNAAISHRRNDESYKKKTAANIKHLKRARQLLAMRELDEALDECEIVLVKDPYNQEAIRLRGQIIAKKKTVLGQEFRVARDGMIADVDKAWRPVYAPNVRTLEETTASTVKTSIGNDDPERSLEQTIVKRMKDMRLPSISFKPPATIIDAVEFFRGASKDFDRPEIPIEQRGFNFVLKTPQTLQAAAPAEEEDDADDFSKVAEEEDASAPQAGVPLIPMITASDISFYDALKLVCESVNYKFKVQGPIVMVMEKNMSTDEMATRSYPVVAAFLERMNNASSDLREMQKGTSFGATNSSSRRNDDEESGDQQRDWKEFFSLMGVQWPEGSSILYIKTIGKLRVKNTLDNLAELEKALTELNVDQKLVEIEARFVEVCQEDLNSLGFEWILNSDYTVGVNNWLGKTLGVKNGTFGSTETTEGTWKYDSSSGQMYKPQVSTGSSVINPYKSTVDASWKSTMGTTVQSGDSTYTGRNIGINAMGGSSQYGQSNRYLSQEGNHVSGAGNSTNDQFMRVNAFLGSADLSMILHMLSQRSDTDLLCAPKVLTRPGENAVMKVVTEYIYPTDYDVSLSNSGSSGSSYGSSGSSSSPIAIVEPQSFAMREVGVILDVTPTLTDDGNLIDLKLTTQVVDEPTWKNYGMKIPITSNSSMQNFEGIGSIYTGLSELFTTMGDAINDLADELAVALTDSARTALEGLTTSDNGIEYYDAPMEQPFFHVRSVDSSVSIYPGATIVMGGLITEERKAMDDKVPFLGDLPFIGRFFRSHAESTSKRNLLIFVTTRLVDVRGREVSLNASDDTATKAAPEPVAAPTK